MLHTSNKYNLTKGFTICKNLENYKLKYEIDLNLREIKRVLRKRKMKG